MADLPNNTRGINTPIKGLQGVTTDSGSVVIPTADRDRGNLSGAETVLDVVRSYADADLSGAGYNPSAAELQFESGLRAITINTTTHRAANWNRILQLNISNRNTRAGTFQAGSDLTDTLPSPDVITSYSGGTITGFDSTNQHIEDSFIAFQFAEAPGNSRVLIENRRRTQNTADSLFATDSQGRLGMGVGNGNNNTTNISLLQSSQITANNGNIIPHNGDIIIAEVFAQSGTRIEFNVWLIRRSGNIGSYTYTWYECNTVIFQTGGDQFSLNGIHLENSNVNNQLKIFINKVWMMEHNGYVRHSDLPNLVQPNVNFFGLLTNVSRDALEQSRDMNFTGEIQKDGNDLLTKNDIGSLLSSNFELKRLTNTGNQFTKSGNTSINSSNWTDISGSRVNSVANDNNLWKISIEYNNRIYVKNIFEFDLTQLTGVFFEKINNVDIFIRIDIVGNGINTPTYRFELQSSSNITVRNIKINKYAISTTS